MGHTAEVVHPAMVSSTSILLLLLTWASVTGVKVKTHEIFGMIGSSVMFPGPNVKIDNDLVLELKKSGSNQDWLVHVHGGPQINDRYATRGQYFQQNGSFLLSNLTEADSGVYDLEVNLTLSMQITLVVIAPVKDPVFLSTLEASKQCQMELHCAEYGGRPLNVSILRNGEEFRGNITRIDNTTKVSLDIKDPQYWGDYVCRVQNPVSDATSNNIKVPPPANPLESISKCISIGTLQMVLLLYLDLFCTCMGWRNPSLISKAFSYTVNTVCVLSELLALLSLLFFYGSNSNLIPLIFGLVIFLSVFLLRVYCVVTDPQRKYVNKTKKLKKELQDYFTKILLIFDYVIVPLVCLVVICLYYSNDYTSCGRGILLEWCSYISIHFCVLVFIICFTCITIISWNKGKKKTEHDLESPAENIELGILSSGADSAIHYKTNGETSEDPLLPADVPTGRGLGEDATAGNSARQISNTADSHSLGTELQVLNLLEESRVGSAGDPPVTG